nr:kinesin-like protein KIF15 isoform X1 [Megalopta genalis]
MANIKVAVRVRPISARELNRTGSDVVVRTDSNGISLTNLKVSSSKAGDSRERTRTYSFDYCFDSSDPEAEHFADQERIYETLGQTVLEAVFLGYNSCLVAYGQSASGKTYTMMGTKDDPGLTPRLCEGLFSRIEDEKRNEKNWCVLVSYLEIYNERVRDLLKPSSSASGLRVREHPRLGPYVQGLTHHVVRTLGSLMSYVEEGTKARKTASTQQNPSSSRSHALLTISLIPESSVAVGASSASASSSARRPDGSLSPPRGGSKLRLVDLAGSESAATCSGIHRLKEGANINKSLVALGNVISALAERGSTGSGPGRRFIPYRDSALTWLLKDALGGNATTIMLATISPASGSYNETAHTLRFAQRAQSVVNRPVVNEDPVARVIRELRAEVARLKSLLSEKNAEPIKALCSCQRIQDEPPSPDSPESPEKESKTLIDPFEVPDADFKREESDRHSKREEQQLRRSHLPFRRSTSTESLSTLDTGCPLKRFGSYELLPSKNRFERAYNRARVTELNDEENEVSEIHESVFVDIPTLVAVLIKPDDNLQESSTQIEEICSDEVAEDGIDVEFIGAEHEGFDDQEKLESLDHDDRSSSVNSCQASVDNELDVFQTDIFKSSSTPKEKPKFRKQDSVDLLSVPIPSNLHISKRFGSVEAIQRKKEPLFPLERSHTNLERRVVPDRAKKLNNIREIEDQKLATKSFWSSSKEPLQRKGSNDSDRSLKDCGSGKSKNARKPSLENLKRKTSKDSSSSSSKDEQISISSLTREKLLHTNDSIEQESSSTRSHTPIQRVKRAQIVAAVTERLYSSKKVPEDASGIRSPPEGTEVKSLARMKLQEISRKMLGKRRRVCVDTQTDCSRTIRMKDTASLTENPEIQDVAVLTDNHEDCEIVAESKTPVLRVKEIATSTDKPKTSIVRCKDVASLANDLEEFEYELHSPRHDSGILSDDTQNYAESNLSSTEVSDVCQETDRGPMHVESSTNTLYSSCRSSAVQTPRPNSLYPRRIETKAPPCMRQCCNSVQEPTRNHSSIGSPEKSVISISLPDTISITIESTNVLESRIAVMDSLEQERAKSRTKDGEVQTEEIKDTRGEAVCFKDDSRSTLSQTDSRVFRIENIFQDPNNVSRRVDATGGRVDGPRMRNSITFRNSLGTSYVSQVRDGEVGGFGARRQGDGFIRDGLITEAFITKKRFDFGRDVCDDPWRKWSVPAAMNSKIQSIGCNDGFAASSWQGSQVGEVAGLASSCSNCSKMEPEVQGESMKLPAFENGTVEHDHSFSDDSLDYNENNALGQTVLKMADCDQRESLCPPDVVAHTKKDCPKVSTSEAESNEPADFEESQIEFPKMKPSDVAEVLQVHDYKDLILGRRCYNYEDVNEEPEDSNRVINSGKKKVSFSNSGEAENKVSLEKESSKQGPKTTLKSIIKKRKKRNIAEIVSSVPSSNDETDDSQHDEKSLILEDDWKDKVSDVEEPSKEGLLDSKMDAKQNHKKVKFSVRNLSENSESDSCENAEDEEEDVPRNHVAKKILEDYLSEAVTFMRNLNSINESINVAGMLDRCSSPIHQKRVGKQGSRRRSYSSPWNLDHPRQEVAVTDDADYLNSDEDIVVSTESYDRCLKGIQRLEDCIRRVDRHNELLRVKYGVNCGSAGARLGLASPSTDRAPATSDFVVSGGREDTSNIAEDWTSPRFVEYSPRSSLQSTRTKNEEEDLEKRIFDQLMNVANATSCRSSTRLQNRFSKSSDRRPRSPVTYSKLREKYNHADESFHGDLQGSLDLNDQSYEITGNLSVAKTHGMSFEDLESTMEDDFLPLRRFDRIEGKLRVDSSRLQRDDSSSRRAASHDDAFEDEYLALKSSYSSQRVSDARGFQEPHDYSRRIRDGDSKVFPKDDDSNETLQFRDKLKYPGSPRARFLELLRERRRIVESSRGTSAS